MADITMTLNYTIVNTEKYSCKLDLQVVATGITNKIFAIEVLPRSADTLAPLYRFSHVCSPAELIEFPDEEPEDECYFRVDQITMLFDTPVLAEHVIKCVQQDIKTLIDAYKIFNEQPDDLVVRGSSTTTT